MSTNKKLLPVIIIAAIIVMLLFSFWSQKGSNKIKIGVITPLSGQYAAFGESVRDAVLLAAKGNTDIEVIVEDSAFDSKKGLSAYTKLTTIDKADTIINLDSPTINAIQPLLDQNHLVTFQLAEAATHAQDSVYQMLPFSYPLYSKLGEEADKRFNKVAVVYGNLDVLLTDAEYFMKGMPSDQIVYKAKLVSDSDMRTEVAKLLAAKPEATTLIVDKETGIKFLKVLSAQKGQFNIKVICDVNLEFAVADYISAVGTDLLDGCISTNMPNTTSEDFKKSFKAAYGYEPQVFSDYAYDAVAIIDRIKGEPKDKWNQLVQDSNFTGASGLVKFDTTGTRIPAVEVHQFKDGKFVKVD